ATDYDGTLAHDGRVDESTVAALHAARRGGIRLIMVTGRELPDLFNTFEHSGLFDRVVAENGALLYDPLTQSVQPMAVPPPPALEALHLTPEQTIGIGDAENDQAFMRLCGLSVAVDNALPAVKEMADVVLPFARGAGVTRLIEMLLAGELDAARRGST